MRLARRWAATLAGASPGDLAAALAALAGAATALVGWWRAPSLWIDEIFVALNLRDRGPLELLGPLDYRQAAPAGFLLAEKAATFVAGGTERALRLLPLAAVVGGILLLPALFRRFGGALGAAAASWLVVSSAPLYRHGIQVKPYGVDFAAAVGVTLLFALAQEGKWSLRAAGLGAAIFALLSFASWIVSAGVLAVLLLRSENRQAILAERGARLGIAALAGAGGIALLFARRQTAGETGEFLRFFWRRWLYDPGAGDRGVADWSIGWLRRLADDDFDARGLVALALALACLTGWGLACRRRGAMALAPPAVVALALALNAAALYPATKRLALFLLPLVATGVAGALQPLDDRLAGRRGRELVAALLIVAAGVARLASVTPGRPIERPREMLRELAAAVRPGDTIYLRYAAVPAWEYYAPGTALAAPELEVVRGVCARERPAAYAGEIGGLCGRRRVWALFSHSTSVLAHEAAVADLLDAMGERRGRIGEERQGPAGLKDVALLFDLGDAGRCRRAVAAASLDALAVRDPWSCRQFDRAGGR